MAPRCVPAEALQSPGSPAQAAMMHSHLRHHEQRTRTTTTGPPPNCGQMKVTNQPPPESCGPKRAG